MAKATVPNQTVIDLLFPIPAGAEDSFVYSKESAPQEIEFDPANGDEEGQDNPLAEGPEVDTLPFEEEYEEENNIAIPTDFLIFSQQLRRAPGGQQVVDVVVQVEDIGGAQTYEFQVTKI